MMPGSSAFHSQCVQAKSAFFERHDRELYKTSLAGFC